MGGLLWSNDVPDVLNVNDVLGQTMSANLAYEYLRVSAALPLPRSRDPVASTRCQKRVPATVSSETPAVTRDDAAQVRLTAVVWPQPNFP
jgi:hypothetical protein